MAEHFEEGIKTSEAKAPDAWSKAATQPYKSTFDSTVTADSSVRANRVAEDQFQPSDNGNSSASTSAKAAPGGREVAGAVGPADTGRAQQQTGSPKTAGLGGDGQVGADGRGSGQAGAPNSGSGNVEAAGQRSGLGQAGQGGQDVARGGSQPSESGPAVRSQQTGESQAIGVVGGEPAVGRVSAPSESLKKGGDGQKFRAQGSGGAEQANGYTPEVTERETQPAGSATIASSGKPVPWHNWNSLGNSGSGQADQPGDASGSGTFARGSVPASAHVQNASELIAASPRVEAKTPSTNETPSGPSRTDSAVVKGAQLGISNEESGSAGHVGVSGSGDATAAFADGGHSPQSGLPWESPAGAYSSDAGKFGGAKPVDASLGGSRSSANAGGIADAVASRAEGAGGARQGLDGSSWTGVGKPQDGTSSMGGSKLPDANGSNGRAHEGGSDNLPGTRKDTANGMQNPNVNSGRVDAPAGKMDDPRIGTGRSDVGNGRMTDPGTVGGRGGSGPSGGSAGSPFGGDDGRTIGSKGAKTDGPLIMPPSVRSDGRTGATKPDSQPAATKPDGQTAATKSDGRTGMTTPDGRAGMTTTGVGTGATRPDGRIGGPAGGSAGTPFTGDDGRNIGTKGSKDDLPVMLPPNSNSDGGTGAAVSEGQTAPSKSDGRAGAALPDLRPVATLADGRTGATIQGGRAGAIASGTAGALIGGDGGNNSSIKGARVDVPVILPPAVGAPDVLGGIRDIVGRMTQAGAKGDSSGQATANGVTIGQRGTKETTGDASSQATAPAGIVKQSGKIGARSEASSQLAPVGGKGDAPSQPSTRGDRSGATGVILPIGIPLPDVAGGLKDVVQRIFDERGNASPSGRDAGGKKPSDAGSIKGSVVDNSNTVKSIAGVNLQDGRKDGRGVFVVAGSDAKTQQTADARRPQDKNTVPAGSAGPKTIRTSDGKTIEVAATGLAPLTTPVRAAIIGLAGGLKGIAEKIFPQGDKGSSLSGIDKGLSGRNTSLMETSHRHDAQRTEPALAISRSVSAGRTQRPEQTAETTKRAQQTEQFIVTTRRAQRTESSAVAVSKAQPIEQSLVSHIGVLRAAQSAESAKRAQQNEQILVTGRAVQRTEQAPETAKGVQSIEQSLAASRGAQRAEQSAEAMKRAQQPEQSGAASRVAHRADQHSLPVHRDAARLPDVQAIPVRSGEKTQTEFGQDRLLASENETERLLLDFELVVGSSKEDDDETTETRIQRLPRPIGRNRKADETESDEVQFDAINCGGATDEDQTSRYDYMVEPGDTLESIAIQQLQDVNLAPMIYRINQSLIKLEVQAGRVAFLLIPGTIISLPHPREIAAANS